MEYVINYFPYYLTIMEEIVPYGRINLENDIDKVLCYINVREPVRLKNYTPDILVKNGVKNLPMYENPAHVRKNILTIQEARKLGLKINKRDNYHGLGKHLYLRAIDSLDNPRAIFKSKIYNNQFLILTMIKDDNNNNIIIPIEVETTTTLNKIKTDINRVKSVYGFDNSRGYNLNDYIKKNLSESKIKKIYEKKEQGTGFSTAASSLIDTNISRFYNNVKCDISDNSNTSEKVKKY